jgi:phosphatidylglycerophosphate synthase
MESISKLRAICQDTRVLIAPDMSSYLYKFYVTISIYFTWFFLKLKISATAVTILSGVVCIIGGYLLASKSIWVAMCGIICFHLYYILDHCDGEIARYNNESSVMGHFLDWYMHLVLDASIFLGLAFGAFTITFNSFMVICAFFAVLTPLFMKTILLSGWTVICWTRLGVMKTGKEIININEAEDASSTITNKPTSKITDTIETNIYKKFKFLAICIFQQYFAVPILLMLVIMQIIINTFFLASFDFRPILIIYAGIIGPFFVFYKLHRAMRNKVLEDGYKRLFANPNPAQVKKEDYFF